MAKGACVVKGGMHGKEAWVCMAKEGGGVRGMHTPPNPPFYEIRPVNARAVRILLECILVVFVLEVII